MEKLFKDYIFIDIHMIYREEIWVENKGKDVQFYIKKYTIFDMTLILSINTHLNESDYMIDKT